ncbi:MAG TPA: hypothetical protein VGC65_09325 [Bacteroidia bacterium]|jgi:hypothetical protein
MMFKIGQLIVALRSHPQGHFQKGDIFNVKRKTRAVCDCMEFLVDIGVKSHDRSQVCGDCGLHTRKNNPILWFSNRNFAPADYSFARSVIRKALKEMEEYQEPKKKQNDDDVS